MQHGYKPGLRLLAGMLALLLSVMLIQPARTLEMDTEETEPTAAETEPTEDTEPPAAEMEPTEIPDESIAPETVPEETLPAVIDETVTEETEPIIHDASAQDGDLAVVSGQGITMRLFNYSWDINKSSGNAAWRPISSYFTFRNSRMTVGTDPTAVNIPSPNTNSAHDQDGFTKYHATVERVLNGGYPVLDLTRNADGTARTDPGVSQSTRSLAYLFSGGDHAVTAYRPGNTILQKSGNHYWYTSASHAVDYDVQAGIFRLRSYTERNSTTANYGSRYGDFLPYTYTGGVEIGTSEDGVPYHVENADTDYWFGMTMEVNFFQTKGGILDGQEMIFSFSGDDDVWVFVDDVLVLDLGGTHGTVDGSINFATGQVLQYLSWGGANSGADARTRGSDTSFPTTIRACFDAAGRTPNGGWSADGNTFASFTEHTLKFFYLERGAAVANCTLDFRLPTLPDESLTVTKDLIADGDSDLRDFIADSLSYRFRVMMADSAGNATEEFFITAGMTYDLLENGSKIGTGTVGDDGCFALKAGQSAQFSKMLEKGGGAVSYVVEEIMPDGLLGQYGGVEYVVSGAGGEAKTEENPAEAFTAFQTGALSAEQTQAVTFRNRVDTSKLGTLQVTKLAAPGAQIPADAGFSVQVKLGGELLPVGTLYDVNGTSKTVETAGILLLRVDETAVLEQGILSGTAYEITELNTAEGGFRASYAGTVQPSGDLECTDCGVTGTFPLAGTVHVTVTNADYDFAVQIPVSKTVLDHQHTDTFAFEVEAVEPIDGGWQTAETLPELLLTVTGTQAANGLITIGYPIGTEGTFYYKISEQPGTGSYIYDSSFFIVEVTAADGSAAVTKLLKNGAEAVDSVSFVNRVTTSLTVTKTITGGTGSVKFPFTATVTLDGAPFLLPQPETGAAYTVSGNVISFSLGHGDSITIPHIPLGAVVTVEEQEHEGFTVSTQIEGVDTGAVPGSGREIAFSGSAMTVHVTNQTSFRLPDTGGNGNEAYILGGAALCACCGAALLYNPRRKEKSASS